MKQYFKSLYNRTVREAYAMAAKEILSTMKDNDGEILDCGAFQGDWYEKLHSEIGLKKEKYFGIEWNEKNVNFAKDKGINVIHGDLNKNLPFEDNRFTCIFALSVLEHLLNGCLFMRECHRTLQDAGTLIILTPNISTYFTIAQLLCGGMPSSGPHPDSNLLVNSKNYKVSSDTLQNDAELDTPVHRHLVVFSYRVLKRFLHMAGFSTVKGYGFGLYPFPNFTQPLLEKLDPFHCHQTLFIAKK